MTAKQQAPIGQTYHQVLGDHITNMPELHQRAVMNAIGEHERALARCKMLEEENQALMQDVARLTRKLHAREDVPPKRARLGESGNGNGRSRVR